MRVAGGEGVLLADFVECLLISLIYCFLNNKRFYEFFRSLKKKALTVI